MDHKRKYGNIDFTLLHFLPEVKTGGGKNRHKNEEFMDDPNRKSRVVDVLSNVSSIGHNTNH